MNSHTVSPGHAERYTALPYGQDLPYVYACVPYIYACVLVDLYKYELSGLRAATTRVCESIFH